MASTTSPGENKSIRLLLLAAVAGLLLTLHLYHPSQLGLWARIFFDSLHVPVFGFIAVCLYYVIPPRFSCLTRALLSLSLTLGLGVLSELAQIFTSRDASLLDLMADAAGAAGFLLVIQSISKSDTRSASKRGAFFLVGTVILGWSLFPLATVTAGYLKRNSIVPTLVQFNSPLLGQFVRRQNLDLKIIHPTEGLDALAMATLGSGPWPGVAFHDVWPDWRGYSTLIIELSYEETTPFEINIRVHDRGHNNAHTDRYNSAFTLQTGTQELRISLETIRNAPRDRPMDLSQIAEIILFGQNKDAGRTFLIQQIRLE